MGSSSGCAPRVDARRLHGAVARGASVSQPEAGKPDQRFPRSRRITARREFQAIYAGGLRAGSDTLTLFGLANSDGICRLGLTVSRKIGGAVRRNRVKRRMREIFRARRDSLGDVPLDLVVNISAMGIRANHDELEGGFLRAAAAARCGRGRPARPRVQRKR